MVHTTHVSGIGYRMDGPAVWRIYDLSTGCPVGPIYPTREMLLADFGRWVRDVWGG